jgi:predicted transcriptional regulator
MDFTDFALLVNASSFVSINQLKTKFKYTVEGLRKRLDSLCSQGLMETMVVKHKTYYRTTKKGYECVLDFYKAQELNVFFKSLKKYETFQPQT